MEDIRKETENLCIECGKKLSGRSDRRFCSTDCRTSYHNREYRRKNREILRINKILKKNYLILESIMAKGKNVCSTRYLYGKGFNFDYMTSIDGFEKGSKARMICYDLAYSLNNKGLMTIESVRMLPDL